MITMTMSRVPASKEPIQAFITPDRWAAWLKKHHAQPEGIWLRHYKKASGIATVTYAQALDEALCWGWIDGQKKPYDKVSWLQRYCARRARSNWSKRNREHVARLLKEKRMQAPGLAQVKAAQADGRWDAAYDPSSTAQVPADLLKALAGHKAALAFFKSLNKANLFAISYRLQTAKKPETRARRLGLIVQMMKDGKRFH
jgi:uncharacterized protein YdeI (YjbR/CyaY-like superfamily)